MKHKKKYLRIFRNHLLAKGYKNANNLSTSALLNACAKELGIAEKVKSTRKMASKFNFILEILGKSTIHITPKRKDKKLYVCTNAFLESYEWRKLRYEVLKKYDGKCMLCYMGREEGLKLHVDHIKPRKLYPDLALNINNLQILCEVCNHGKGNWDHTDWRIN